MPMVLAALAVAAALHPLSAAGRQQRRRLPAPLVVIDPGHGGKDSGAVHGGAREDEINLRVAYALAAMLRQDGYRVVLTRGLGCRPVWIRAAGPRPVRAATATLNAFSACRANLRDRVLDASRRGGSVFLSLHCDHYDDPSVAGPRTYYGRGSDLQKALAADIQRNLDTMRTRPFTPAAADHFVLVAQPAVPAVTIELGFLTNPRERALLETQAHRQALARAIARGLAAFARTHPLLPPPPVDRVLVETRWQRRHPHGATRRGDHVPGRFAGPGLPPAGASRRAGGQ